jgi:hypothetical protein
LEPGFPGVISFVAQLALENIATSDAAYHDVNHTIMVTLVGQEILRGRHISVGGVSPRDWLHFTESSVSLGLFLNVPVRWRDRTWWRRISIAVIGAGPTAAATAAPAHCQT